MKKRYPIITLISGVLLLLSSCGKNDKYGLTTTRFTVSATQIEPLNGDQLSIVFNGANNETASIWKIDGAVQNNSKIVTLSANDFAQKPTIVVESATPLSNVSVTIQGTNSGSPFTIDYIAQINGKVQTTFDQSIDNTISTGFNY